MRTDLMLVTLLAGLLAMPSVPAQESDAKEPQADSSAETAQEHTPESETEFSKSFK